MIKKVVCWEVFMIVYILIMIVVIVFVVGEF